MLTSLYLYLLTSNLFLYLTTTYMYPSCQKTVFLLPLVPEVCHMYASVENIVTSSIHCPSVRVWLLNFIWVVFYDTPDVF